MNKNYLIFLKRCLITILVMTVFSALITPVYAQTKATGVVTDRNGDPLVGVSIKVKDKPRGAVTGRNGTFEIDLPSSSVLIFSYVGYLSKEVAVSSNMNVVLVEDANSLNEVVVVAYGTQRKETVTGAITTIKTKDILQSSAANITNALTGRLPGLTTIQSSGRPGFDEARLLIRGQSTWVNANPLIIVDGMERESFSQVDPNEVESVSILKDASATAVYGVRGANGVILITTKRGKIGKPSISITQNVAMQKPSRIPKYLGSYDNARLLNVALENDGKVRRFSDVELQKFKDGSDPFGYPDVDWWDEFTKPASLQNQTNVNVSGGTERVRYFTSLGYLHQSGMFEYTDVQKNYNTNTNFGRINFRSNLDVTINKYQELSANISGRIEDRNGFGTNASENYLGSVQQLFYSLNSIPPYAFSVFNPDGSIGGSPGGSNPYQNIVYSGFNNEKLNSYDIILRLNNKLDFITPGLSALINVSTNSKFATRKTYSETVASYQYIPGSGQYNQVSEDRPLTFVDEDLNSVGYRQTNLQAQINYARVIGDHNITALALYNQLKSETKADIPSALLGTAARVTYGYKGRYNVEFNLGYNGSENFAPGHRFGLFPAYSASWLISEENFIKDHVPQIDLLKLRGSYGIVGNDKIGGDRFLYQSVYGTQGANNGTNQFFKFGTTDPSSSGGITETRQGNPNLRWETATKRNIGLELEMFKNKLGLVVDFFDEDRKDILMEARSFPELQGGPIPFANIGRVKNKGYEIELRYSDTLFEDWRYSIKGNVAYAKNKIINRDDPGGTPYYQKLAGYSIGQQRGFTVLGYFQSKEDIANSPSQVGLGGPIIPGDLKYKDFNGDNVLDALDMAPIGYSDVPEYSFASQIGISYKALSLNVLLQGAAKSSVMFVGPAGFEFVNSSGATQATPNILDYWTPDNPNASYPALHTGASHNNKTTNTLFLKSGEFLRLKNVELAYTLPARITNKLKLSNVRIYVNGDNLYTWSKTGNFDPEVLSGTSGSVYPVQTVYNFGINVNF